MSGQNFTSSHRSRSVYTSASIDSFLGTFSRKMWTSSSASRELRNIRATAVARNPASKQATITVKCTVAGQSQSQSRTIGANATTSFTFNFSNMSSLKTGTSVDFYFTNCQPAANGGFTADYYLYYPTFTVGDYVDMNSPMMKYLGSCGATLGTDDNNHIRASGTRFEGPGIGTGPGQGAIIGVGLLSSIYDAMQSNFGDT